MFNDPMIAIHTLLSLAAIAAGLVAIAGFFAARVPHAWQTLFIATAVATSATGFLLPVNGVTPAVVVGMVALIVLTVVIIAQYRFRLAGGWRATYAIGMVVSLYLLVFVGVAQAFDKNPFLHTLAPNGSELPFVVAQSITLALFVGLGIGVTRASRARLAA